MIHLREFLKVETRDLHARTERAFARFDLTRREAYGEFLLAQATALLPLEAALTGQGAGDALEDWPLRARGELLRADLAALGLSEPLPQAEPRFANPDQLLGALYVLEGSKLGARLLLARVLAAHPAAAGATAFLAHGSDPARTAAWPSFLARLEAAPCSAARAAEALAGATAAFAMFGRAARGFVKA